MKKQEITFREAEILNEIANGKGRMEICVILKISESTYDTHLHSLHVKTETQHQTALVLWAIDNGYRKPKVPSKEN